MYYPRIADNELTNRLASAGAVVIEGPKACGKTAMARQIAKSEVLLDVDENARQAIAVDPKLVLAGDVPRLIDEWQLEPSIWNHIRRMVDDRRRSGQFILTGSAIPADDITRHTGAGRISRLKLRTMSLLEMGVSAGKVSLGDLFNGNFSTAVDPGLSLQDIVEHLCRGGWPGNIGLSGKAHLLAQRDYLEEIQRLDISRVDGVRRDLNSVKRVIRSLARNVATLVSLRTIAIDAGGPDGPLDEDTIRSYLLALQRLMIYEEQPAWSPALRSRSILRKSPKRHFIDPSLAVAALGATPDALLQDLNTLGFLFESMVYRDLCVYARANDASVYHYRDNTGLEVDMIVADEKGRWCAFEVKLGAGQVDKAAASLLKFSNRIDTRKSGPSAMLAVIVSSGYGYMRPDGVAVIPVGVLGP